MDVSLPVYTIGESEISLYTSTNVVIVRTWGEGYSKIFYTRRLRPEVKTIAFRIHLIESVTPLYTYSRLLLLFSTSINCLVGVFEIS